MKKITFSFIAILAVLLLTGCPGVGQDPKTEPLPAASSDAALTSLTITAGAVNHVFTTIETSYSITVGFSVDSITVTPVFSDANAVLTIGGMSIATGSTSAAILLSVGVNTITLLVTAEDGVTTVTYTVTVTRLDTVDNTAPVITLTGDNPLSMEVNTAYFEPGYSAIDTEEGDLENAVIVTGSVNTSTVGSYTLYYNVSDSSGNTAAEIIRTVNVLDPLAAPTISLASGTYTSPQTVTLTHSVPGVRIYYTLDTSWIPDESAGTLYTGPITISNPATLITRGFLEGLNPSSWSGCRADYAIVAPGETNMIANGDFSYGLALWEFWAYSQSMAEAEFSVVNGEFTANITNGSDTDWHIGLGYAPALFFEQDTYYQLDFTAWAATEREIEVATTNNLDGIEYKSYLNTKINLITTPQNFSKKFLMNDIDDPQVTLEFRLGIENADVYIDDISLEKIIPVVLTTADVPDANLRSVFENKTGKAFGQITDLDLALLDWIDLEGEDFIYSDLTGIEYCTGLISLGIDSTDITDFTLLANLTHLEELFLDGNNISDISFLSGLTLLRELDIRWNQISSIATLANLTNLESLEVDNNNIDDLSVLSQLSNLRFLSLGENPLDVSDLSVLSTYSYPDLWGLRLSNRYDLGGGSNPINLNTDLTGLLNILDDLDSLSYLLMDDFYMNDSQFSSLYTQVLAPRSLEWSELKITDSDLTNASLPSIANLSNLKCLDLFANNITELSALEGMINLSELALAENEFTDLTPLETMYNNGAFRDDGSWDENEIDIRDCNLELWPGSPNRNIVDSLIGNSVSVVYEQGNQLVP